jgi:hypothetical protein
MAPVSFNRFLSARLEGHAAVVARGVRDDRGLLLHARARQLQRILRRALRQLQGRTAQPDLAP